MTFLKNCWYVAAWGAELDDQAVVARRILNLPVLLFRTADGQLSAFEDRCPHRLAPLSAGQRIGDAIRCGYHGMTFGPDGVCIDIPGQERIPAAARVRTFPIVSRHAHLWIWMGDAELADPQLIPNVPWPGLDGWTVSQGYTHFEADYRLLTDNLLDLSHESYLHESTIGNDATEAIADFPVQVTVEGERVVSAHREMLDIESPPFFQAMVESDGHIDRWQTALWTAPSVNMTNVRAKVAGAADETTRATRVLHLLTPETDTSTHYFWSLSRDFRVDDAALTDTIRDAIYSTFNEDKAMLESQQCALKEVGGDLPKIAIGVDDAPLRARRLLASLIEQEADKKVVIAPQQSLI